jgi:hypothetical protein
VTKAEMLEIRSCYYRLKLAILRIIAFTREEGYSISFSLDVFEYKLIEVNC